MRMQFAAACLGGVLLMACSAPESVSADQDVAEVASPADETAIAETVVDTVVETVAATTPPAEMTTETDLPVDAQAMCTQDYAPVCGANGETYGNACEAAAESVEIATAGECHADEEPHN